MIGNKIEKVVGHVNVVYFTGGARIHNFRRVRLTLEGDVDRLTAEWILIGIGQSAVRIDRRKGIEQLLRDSDDVFRSRVGEST